ncbi:MAG TPA: DNA replication/repair protein RecF [Acidimicrobiales bacterium]|nr:DNA replication/repair protein RecF [Acidimicrobiales bacterium]
MRLGRLWLTDFRNYASADLVPAADGLTVVVGANGEGKTNLLEAMGYLATLASFRGVTRDAMVRQGRERAVVRAEVERDGRQLLLEAEISLVGRDRVLVNRQPLRRARDLLGALRVTVFSPDDLVLVKGGPADRREYLDDTLTALHPRNDALRAELDRILRHRNALLKQLTGPGARPGGRIGAEAETTLDVWDAKLAEAGEAMAEGRTALGRSLEPEVAKAYDQVARTGAAVEMKYRRSWEGSLADAVAAARPDDLRRGITTVGPHRDDLELTIDGMPARTHASQGEQRSLALALRLASHAVVTEATGSPPVLLLDDVFSELDADRQEALVDHLPAGQALLTTTGGLPARARPQRVVNVHGGRLS